MYSDDILPTLFVFSNLSNRYFFPNALLARPIEVELLVDKNYKPYSYVDNGKVTGINNELIEDLNSQFLIFKVTIKIPMMIYSFYFCS